MTRYPDPTQWMHGWRFALVCALLFASVLLQCMVSGCGGTTQFAPSTDSGAPSDSGVPSTDSGALVDADANLPVTDAGDSGIICMGDQCPCQTDTSWGVMRCFEQSRGDKIEYKCAVRAIDCSPVTEVGDPEFCRKETVLRQLCECTELHCGIIEQCWCSVPNATDGGP